MQTAGIIALHFPEIPVQPARLLWECIPYVPPKFIHWYRENATNLIEGKDQIPLQYHPWLATLSSLTSLEKIDTGFDQAERAYQRYFKPTRKADRHEIIVSHGNLIRYFVTRVMGAPPESWLHNDIANCGISEVIITADGKALLISHNDTGHLPDGKRTFL